MESSNKKPNEDNLVTERDNDPDFGLFREESYPDADKNEVQKRLIDNELPRDNHLPRKPDTKDDSE